MNKILLLAVTALLSGSPAMANDTLDDAKETALELAEQAGEKTREVAGKVGEKASEIGSEAAEKAKETGSLLWDKMKEVGSSAKSLASDGLTKAGEMLKDEQQKCEEDAKQTEPCENKSAAK